jgi:hypothetical protein
MCGSRQDAQSVASSATASIRYRVGNPSSGMRPPASSGPATAPVWNTVIVSALAAGSCSEGRSRGSTALRVGWSTAMNAVWRANSDSTSHTPPSPVAAVTNSSSDVPAIPVTVTSSRVRRSTASAIAPPHKPNTISGTSPNRPVSPTHADESVRW